MLELLRPKPFRGDQVAAGTVVLTVLVALLNVRFGAEWSVGRNLTYTAAAAALVLGMAVAAPAEPEGPPPWHSALYVAGFLLAAATLANLADALGSDGGPGTFVWIGLALTALAAWMSQVRGSASGTLLGALTAVGTTAAFLDFAGDPELSTYRWLLVLDTAVLVLAALWERVRGPAHGVQLLNAVGLTLLAIAATFALTLFGALFFGFAGGGGGVPDELAIGTGWTLLVLAGGIGILAAGAADDERGNVFVGTVLLAVFVLMANEGDLVGWPILLGAAAAALLVIGLRPSTPLPDTPPAGAGVGAPRSRPDPPLGDVAPLPPVRPIAPPPPGASKPPPGETPPAAG